MRSESRDPVRVLVAEDFVPYRRTTCSTLASLCGLQVVGEACDGLEAIQKAVELRPDLTVLDIDLPSLNGIEVARETQSLVPESIIIFLTQESSADVVQKAFSVGVRGYAAKRNAVTDLWLAWKRSFWEGCSSVRDRGYICPRAMRSLLGVPESAWR